MDANEFVEKFFPDGLEITNTGNREEELTGLRESQTNGAFDMTRMSDACSGTEEQMFEFVVGSV